MNTADNMNTGATKPILKVTVGGPKGYNRAYVCYTYLVELPGYFQKLGHSAKPEMVRERMQADLVGCCKTPLILTQVRAFRYRTDAAAYENLLHERYAKDRVMLTGYYPKIRPGKYYSPDILIHL